VHQDKVKRFSLQKTTDKFYTKRESYRGSTRFVYFHTRMHTSHFYVSALRTWYWYPVRSFTLLVQYGVQGQCAHLTARFHLCGQIKYILHIIIGF